MVNLGMRVTPYELKQRPVTLAESAFGLYALRTAAGSALQSFILAPLASLHVVTAIGLYIAASANPRMS
jgi:hypothetical protein